MRHRLVLYYLDLVILPANFRLRPELALFQASFRGSFL